MNGTTAHEGSGAQNGSNASRFPDSQKQRLNSLDQFRGFVVLGMVFVNFIGDFDWVQQRAPVLRHNNTYFSFADTIMPAFHFAVGFSLRLSFLRLLNQVGTSQTLLRFLRRILGLALIGVVLEFSANKSLSWGELTSKNTLDILMPLLKSGFWNTLTIIAVASLWVLPVAGARARWRICYLFFGMALHLAICHAFYFNFLVGRPNILSDSLGSTSIRGLDGGPLGFLAWGSLQLAGTLVCDLMVGLRQGTAFIAVLLAGLLCSAVGYLISCLAMLYPVTQPPTQKESGLVIATSPVILPAIDWKNIDYRQLRALPPFVQPAAEEQREYNYWLVSKRIVSLPFQFTALGYSLLVFAAFLLLSDGLKISLGLLRTFGQNPLASYLAHEIISRAVASIAPSDAPLYWVIGSFGVYFLLTYSFIRQLEKKKIFLRM
ncbi:DUF1624 domain-containing protein [Telmatocola sphagniphila]|uniref:DUF1624 domain-containing protein n=1 Tax=Telmatocola sphagniphila TaxID=1123043 RepID=A0A8E6B9S5_9BACT|nr:heparan-alpha-glucosaminide N-acetyltransferase domain-containing protein [Telmatocola sphagniphila]QVL33183.1 DUF1624 domain-containing protein [Telmatocola sphagniphila]